MAEALSRSKYGDRIEPVSAGVDPWPDLHPMARKLMAERGETFAGHYPKHVNTFRDAELDIVVTIGDRALAESPSFSKSPRHIHWAISDPADADGTPDLEKEFRSALRAIEQNLDSFLTDGETRTRFRVSKY